MANNFKKHNYFNDEIIILQKQFSQIGNFLLFQWALMIVRTLF